MSKKDEIQEAAVPVEIEPETSPNKEKPAVKKLPGQPKKKTDSAELRPVEELSAAANIPAWELAGLMRAAGWAGGKQVTQTTFEKALAAFRNRGQGRGKIAVEE